MSDSTGRGWVAQDIEPIEGEPNLAIRTNQQTDRDLAEINVFEGYNKTTACNRGVQWYAECARILRGGGQVYLRLPGTDVIESVHLE